MEARTNQSQLGLPKQSLSVRITEWCLFVGGGRADVLEISGLDWMDWINWMDRMDWDAIDAKPF